MMGSSDEEEMYTEDLKALTSQIKNNESLLRLKRRWLMDLPLSKTEQRRIQEVLPGSDKMLPESYIREDDLGYEEIWTRIKTGFGINNHGKEHSFVEEDLRVCISRNDFQDIFFLLNDMTSKGLCSFIRMLTGRMIIIDKINGHTKMIIEESLSKLVADNSDASRKKFKQLCQLLKDPKKIHRNKMVHLPASEAYRATASVMDVLEEFPLRTLSAMYRKLRVITGYVPSVQPRKFGEPRYKLISRVKKLLMKMQSDLGEVGKPARPLADALGVAGLTLKLMNRPTITDFRKISSETEAFQNNILQAIHLLNDSKRVSLVKLKQVQLLLDPMSQLSVRSLRMAVRNFLIEYLFECNDMDMMIPCFLVETVDIINRRSQLPYEARISHQESPQESPQESIMDIVQKDVDCVLTVSAQAREVVLNLLPELEFDEDFAQAYMGDFEGNDTHQNTDDDKGQLMDVLQHYEFHLDNSCVELESLGETDATVLNSPLSMRNGEDSSLIPSSNGRSLVSKIESVEVCGSISPEELCVTPKPYLLMSAAKLGLSDSDFLKATADNKLSSLSQSPDIKSIQNGVKTEEAIEDTSIMSRQNKSSNQYLELQKACDNTSMEAYHFADLILDRLAISEDVEISQDILHSSSSDLEHSGGFPSSYFASKFAEILNDVCQGNPATRSSKSSGRGRSKKLRAA